MGVSQKSSKVLVHWFFKNSSTALIIIRIVFTVFDQVVHLWGWFTDGQELPKSNENHENILQK